MLFRFKDEMTEYLSLTSRVGRHFSEKGQILPGMKSLEFALILG